MSKNKEVQLFTPYKQQMEVINALEDKKIRYVTMICARQIGKSLLAMNMALSWALNDAKCRIYWISPVDAQVQKVYRDLLLATEGCAVIKSSKCSKGDIEISFNNGSVIYFRTAGSEDSLRGESVNYMILDEAAFVKKDTVYEVLLPMLTVTGKKLLVITTPKGRANWTYDFYMAGFTDPRYRSFKWKSIESPYANKEFIEDQKKRYNPKVFQQEYEAEFIDSSSLFNNLNDIMTLDYENFPDVNNEYYGGIDVGILHDSTVFSVINKEGNLVNQYRWTNIETPQLLENIVNVFNRWKFKRVYIEDNNQGIVIYQSLANKVNNLERFNTNRINKPKIIMNLVHRFNMNEIKICKNEQLRVELESFIMIVGENNTKYEASSGMTDDTVMSLAIANEAWGKKSGNKKLIKFW